MSLSVVSYQAYIFDVDGTILDTAPRILDCICEALSLNNISFLPQQITYDLIGPKISEIFDILLVKENQQQKENFINSFRKIYDENPVLQTKMYSQAKELLDILNSKGAKLFIATNKPKLPLQKLLNYFSLTYFNDIYTPDKYENKILTKIEMVSEIIEKNSLSSKNVLFIGDTKGDYEASKINHCPFAFASWGYGKDKTFLSEVAQKVLT